MSARAHLNYLVEKYRGYWTVIFGGKPNGQFANRGEACHSALQDGIRVGHLGHDVKIEVREQDGNTTESLAQQTALIQLRRNLQRLRFATILLGIAAKIEMQDLLGRCVCLHAVPDDAVDPSPS